jgi:hypothetical protein
MWIWLNILQAFTVILVLQPLRIITIDRIIRLLNLLLFDFALFVELDFLVTLRFSILRIPLLRQLYLFWYFCLIYLYTFWYMFFNYESNFFQYLLSSFDSCMMRDCVVANQSTWFCCLKLKLSLPVNQQVTVSKFVRKSEFF